MAFLAVHLAFAYQSCRQIAEIRNRGGARLVDILKVQAREALSLKAAQIGEPQLAH
jgi:hypothetical protein